MHVKIINFIKKKKDIVFRCLKSQDLSHNIQTDPTAMRHTPQQPDVLSICNLSWLKGLMISVCFIPTITKWLHSDVLKCLQPAILITLLGDSSGWSPLITKWIHPDVFRCLQPAIPITLFRGCFTPIINNHQMVINRISVIIPLSDVENIKSVHNIQSPFFELVPGWSHILVCPHGSEQLANQPRGRWRSFEVKGNKEWCWWLCMANLAWLLCVLLMCWDNTYKVNKAENDTSIIFTSPAIVTKYLYLITVSMM